ncbi:MAG: isochorismatase family protein [Legionellales bacterium]
MLLNKEDSILLLVDVQEKFIPTLLDGAHLIARCEWLLKLAKRMAVPILASEQYPKGLGATLAQLSAYFEGTECIEKVHFSCMQEPRYVTRLREFNKNQLIITGIEAHVCVLQTALEMQAADFDVFVVVDAVTSRHAVDLSYGLKRMQQAGIHLITSEMVFFEWLRTAGSLDFKALAGEFLGTGE